MGSDDTWASAAVSMATRLRDASAMLAVCGQRASSAAKPTKKKQHTTQQERPGQEETPPCQLRPCSVPASSINDCGINMDQRACRTTVYSGHATAASI